MKVYTLTPGSEVIGRGCAFCGDTLRTGDRIVQCPVCLTFHHTECWHFGGNKCARLGCTGHGEIAGAKAVPLIQSSVTTASQVIRIRPGDIERTVRAAPRRVAGASAAASGIWGNALGSMVLSAVLSLLLGLIYRFAGAGLNWAMGAQRLQATFLLGDLCNIGQSELKWWALGGAIYGLFHHRFLTGKTRGTYQFARLVISLLYLGSLSYQVGYLMFTPGYRWPTLLWELPSKVLWLAPFVAWGAVIIIMLMTIVNYTSRLTVFEEAAGVVALLIIMTLRAYLRTLDAALTWGGGGWILGTVVDFIWRGHDYSASWSQGGLAIGGSIGFIVGLLAVFQQMES